MKISFENGELDVHLSKVDVEHALVMGLPFLQKVFGQNAFTEKEPSHEHAEPPVTAPGEDYFVGKFKTKKVECPICKRSFNTKGFYGHFAGKHPGHSYPGIPL